MGNQSNNLSIKRLRIVVNATSGAIDHSGDDTGFIDQERLYRLTQENCNRLLQGGRLPRVARLWVRCAALIRTICPGAPSL